MRNIQLTTAITFNLPQIEDITDSLPKKQTWETLPNKKNIVRNKWDGTFHTGFRKPEDIDTIAIHHSGPPDGTLESHAGHHSRKWGAGIAYHIAIDQGRIFQTNDLLSFTFHVGGHNTYTVAIMINADLSQREMTSQERELLYGAILTVKSLLPIKHILGHNEFPEAKTSCPCTSMNQIRNDIASLELNMALKAAQPSREKRVKKFVDATNRIVDLCNKARDPNFQYTDIALDKGDLIVGFLERENLLNP